MLCSSYSGDTEETIACYEAAEALGAKRIVATTGGALADGARGDGVPVIGLPRASSRARRSATCSRSPPRSRLWPERRRDPHRDRRRRRLPREAGRRRSRSAPRRSPSSSTGSIPVIYGADLTAPVALRWKTQVNENAKLPAFTAELPEADHNEIGGWAGARRGRRA